MKIQRDELKTRLLRYIGSAGASEAFDGLARAVFAFQFVSCPPFQALCRYRGIDDPQDATALDDIPLIPTDSFKLYRIASFPPDPAERRFETSGTTTGRPGIHVMRDTGIYDAAAVPGFRRAMQAGHEPDSFRYLALTGSPTSHPRSSLVHMIRKVADGTSGASGAQYFYEGEELDFTRLETAVSDAAASSAPVMLLTTAFALVQLIESLEGRGQELHLPPGSRIMETGGYKGRSRELSAPELYERASRVLGVEPRWILNEYGMTEMSSQFYDRTGQEGALDDPGERVKVPPPWVRPRVLRPSTLSDVDIGEIGMLAHMDLLNLDSCAFLLTGDAALRTTAGFILLGRFSGRELRGCSLDYEGVAG